MIEYMLTAGTRYSEHAGREYPVEEIRVDGELVGVMYVANNHRFAEVVDAGGAIYPHGDCVLDSSNSRDIMVSMIMQHREVGNREDWRALVKNAPRPETRRVDHDGHFLFGVDQGNTTNEGRAVVTCDGKRGIVVPGAPHCSYGVTVAWDNGTQYYTNTKCLWWADDPDAPQVSH